MRPEDTLKLIEPKKDQISTFYPPTCMQAWRSEKTSDIKRYLDEFFGALKQKIFAEGGCSRKTVVAITGDKFTMPWYFGQFPHVANLFSRFFSILLWQRETYGVSEPCAKTFMVNDDLTNFWGWLALENSWVHAFSHSVNNLFGENLFSSNSSLMKTGKQVEYLSLGWSHETFLHASDAFLLSSNLVKKDPCILHEQKLFLLQKPLNIIIINRNDVRNMLNIDQVHETVTLATLPGKQAAKENPFLVNVIEVKFFDNVQFLDQVRKLYDTDIYISIHGAALTNLIFMKPCSIVIEIFPWLFHDYKLFGRMAESADVIHYYWMESPENTMRPSVEHNRNCADLLKHFHHVQNTSTHYRDYELTDIYAPDSLSSRCMRNPVCHDCTKHIKGLKINIEKLKDVLNQSLEKRNKCIAGHPFYNKK